MAFAKKAMTSSPAMVSIVVLYSVLEGSRVPGGAIAINFGSVIDFFSIKELS